MNNVHFACTECKTFIDAGYRWARWCLEEPGIVAPGAPVDIDRVLSNHRYWEGWEEETPNSPLATELPKVRAFLNTHKSHVVIWGTITDFGYDCPDDEFAFLEWIDDGGKELLPRFFAERLGHRNWSEVRTYVEGLNEPPLWWDYADLRSRAWHIFRNATNPAIPPCP